ncbi:response regulator transcription factor [Gorillibacterium sp. sgz5001074]|uniref:response regulator transcription factor n=1 Tax=Gorillibacterium sp. sgz5001074 TaxID=3446695 RepID=UPI003F670988
MYKVLLVDDEVFVRKGLQKLIRWEQFKCTLVGEAKNGGEALEMIHRLEPDLVITDIMMPVLDGLELIRSVKEESRVDPEFIIISGYNDFKYAQQAIRYGVKDYILKPIDVKELGATLERLAQTIAKKRLSALTKTDYSISSILDLMLHEEMGEKDAERYAEVLGMEGESGFLYVWAQFQTMPGQPPVRLKELQEWMSGWEGAGAAIPILEHAPGQFGILWSIRELNRWGNGIPQALEAVRSLISSRLNQELLFCAGDMVDSLASVKRSYAGANEALKHRFAEEDKRVILIGQVKDKALHIYDMDSNLSDRLMVHLEENNKEACRSMIDKMFQSFRNQRYTPAAVVLSLTRFMTRVMGVIKQMHGSDDGQRRMLEEMETEVQTWSVQRLREHFTVMVLEAAGYVAQLRKEQSKGDIEKIKKHIDSHYSENINLKSIAAHFYMNPAYLGQLFRKTYGIYFNEYLLQVRVEEAKKLLRQTDLRMYEIAERVGIPVANYFVTQFEKIEQCSPLEYRNKLVKKE